MKRFFSLIFFTSITCLLSNLACGSVEKEAEVPSFAFTLQQPLQPQNLSEFPITNTFRKDTNAYKGLRYNAGIQVGYLRDKVTAGKESLERPSKLYSCLDYGKFSLSTELIVIQGAPRKFINQSAKPWAFRLQPSYRIWKDYEACLGYSCFWDRRDRYNGLSGYSALDTRGTFVDVSLAKVHSVYIGVGTNVSVLNRFLKEDISVSLGYEYSRASQLGGSKKNAKVDMNAVRTRLQWVF